MSKNIIDKIKQLRNKTGVGMMLCKEALLKTNGNMEEAVLFLRKKGFFVAQKRVSKATSAGLVSVLLDDSKKNAVIIEVNCETDFVAKSPKFISFVSKLLDFFIKSDIYGKNFYKLHKEICLNEDINNDRLEFIASVGENITINRVKRICVDKGYLSYYVHGSSDFGTIGSILLTNNESCNFLNLVDDISMQIVAMNPKYLSIKDVPSAIILREKELYYEAGKNKYVNKNKSLLEKIVNGQIKNFYKDVVLLEQMFIKDQKLSVRDTIFNKFELLDFVRFEVGENV